MTSKSILLVDDDDDFLQLLRERCRAIGLRVDHARNLLTATMIVSKRIPDMVCVDIEMPTGSGLAFCEGLAADPATSNIPVVVLTGKSDPEARIACERLRAYHVHKTASFWPGLESILRQLAAETIASGAQGCRDAGNRLRTRDELPVMPGSPFLSETNRTAKKTIVVADDDQDMLQLLAQRFSSLGCSVIGVDNALEAINVINRCKPDLVCLDVGMPSGNGLSVCEMMASAEDLRKIPIIILTGRSDDDTIRRCHDLLVYYVQKSADTWERVAPLACDLIDLNNPALAS